MSDEPSEFGKGIVVCLAKFSEHLSEHGPYSERMIMEYARWTPEEKAYCEKELRQYPHGDAAQKLARMTLFEMMERLERSKQEVISHAIEMWMNAASDHFYDLDERAPKPLKELADLALRIGHGFTGEIWTVQTIQTVRELWQQSCLAVDRMLGIEPDWGDT
jgi:hypothetical protein